MPDRHSHIKIKAHNPWHIWIVSAVLVVLGCIVSAIMYFEGLNKGLYDVDYKQNFIKKLEQRVEDLDRNNRKFASVINEKELAVRAAQQTITALQREKEIDRVALENVNQDLIEQQKRIGELTEQLAFYKAILSPKSQAAGLAIQRFVVLASDEPSIYSYDLTLVQALRQEAQIKGQVTIQLEGVQDGDVKTLSFKTISMPAKDKLAYNFKYYQKFNGLLKLPEGFVAIRAKVEVKPKGRSAKPVTASYNWNNTSVVDSGRDIAEN